MDRVSRRGIVPLALLFAACLLLPAAALAADVKLPNVFGTNMVLQRGMPVPVWGTATAGKEITVEFAGQKKTATADGAGKWKIVLDKMKAKAKPQTLTVTGGAKPIEFKNVLIGEVWVCSGQSNMEWHLRSSTNGGKDIPAAKQPKIRLFHIPKRQAGAPAADVNAAWTVCSPQTVPTFSGVAYYFGLHLVKKLGVPVGLVNTSWGGSPIQPWTPPVGYDLVPEFKEKKIGNRGGPGMYNAMIHPLIPFAIRGAIWYQGESNVNEATTYHARMQALILGWRKAWGQDLSFYFVQLAPWTGYAGGMLPLQWEAQTATLSTPKTGMAVIHDTIGGAVGDIHPRNKHDVGKRLALWALAKDYGRKRLVYSGPLYKSMRVKRNKVILTFDHVGEGLKSRGGKPLDWFTIAGADKKFVPAKAKIVRNRIVVVSEQVAKPVAVRFAWNKTARPNLMNKDGLPAGPFRTDRW